MKRVYKGVEFQVKAIPAKRDNDPAFWFIESEQFDYMMDEIRSKTCSCSFVETINKFKGFVDESLKDLE